MEELFSNCYYLVDAKFINFNASNIKILKKKFENCYFLKNIKLDGIL